MTILVPSIGNATSPSSERTALLSRPTLNQLDAEHQGGARWLIIGAICGFTGVALGALAAHGLERRFDELYGLQTRTVAGMSMPLSYKYLLDFKTGAEYQLVHGLALLVVGTLAQSRRSAWLTAAGWSFTVGIVLFSGCLYALTLLGLPKLGMIVPIGGVLFLVGWFCLMMAAWRRSSLE